MANNQESSEEEEDVMKKALREGPYQNLVSFLQQSSEEDEDTGYNFRQPIPRGQGVETLDQLQDPDQFLLFQPPSSPFTTKISKQGGRVLSHLFMNESTYKMDFAPVRGKEKDRRIFTLIDLIKQTIEELYRFVLSNRTGQNEPEIQILINSVDLRPPISSGIYPLIATNCVPIVNELITQLLQYSQSKSREITLADIDITFTIADTRLGGDGSYLPLKRYYKNKRYCARLNVGSVLLVESQELCFFVAIFFARVYGGSVDRIANTTSVAEKQRQRILLDNILTSADAVLRTKRFFEALDLDIDSLPPGDLTTMMIISTVLDCTISILDEGNRYKCVLQTPATLDPVRPHIILIRVGLLEANKATPTGSVKAKTVFHYHSVRSLQAVMGAQRLYWCVYCGTAIPSNCRQRHLKNCKAGIEHCESCRRPLLEANVYPFVKPHQRPEFCVKAPDDVVQCDQMGCRVVSQGPQCRQIHIQHCTNYVCRQCRQVVRIQGKYMELLRRKKMNKEDPLLIDHEHCDEMYCTICQEHYRMESLDVKRDRSHECFMKSLGNANRFAPISVLDIETRHKEPGELKKTELGAKLVGVVLSFISPKPQKELQNYSYEGRMYAEMDPDAPFHGVPLGAPYPVNIEGQNTYITEELLRFDKKKRSAKEGNRAGGEDGDEELLVTNVRLNEVIHRAQEYGMAEPLFSSNFPGMTSTPAPPTENQTPQSPQADPSTNVRLVLDNVLQRFRREEGVIPSSEPDFNLNAQRARHSEHSSSSDEDEEVAPRRPKRKRRKTCPYIDDMAEASGSNALEETTTTDTDMEIGSPPKSASSTTKNATNQGGAQRHEAPRSPKKSKKKNKQLTRWQSSSHSDTDSATTSKIPPRSESPTSEQTQHSTWSSTQSLNSEATLHSPWTSEEEELPSPPNLTSEGEELPSLLDLASNDLGHWSLSDPDNDEEFSDDQESSDDDDRLLLESDLIKIAQTVGYCAHETDAKARKRVRKAYRDTRRYQAQAEESENPVLDQFFEWLFSATHLRGSVILCHYGKRFDAILLTEYLTVAGYPFKVIEVANSLIGLMILKINIIVLDFFNFISCGLDKLPKNLGLSTQCKKGFFPHRLNKIENYGLELPHVPDRELYQEWKMSPERRVEFDAWFKSVRHDRFVFREQILDYCLTDTLVLHAACLKFVKMALELEQRISVSYGQDALKDFRGGDRLVYLPNGHYGFPRALFPFSRQSWTLSGYTSLLMRKLVLPHFPLMPLLKHEDQDVGMARSSKEELLFLLFIQLKKYKKLQYALTGENQKTFTCIDRQMIPPKSRTFHVDGYCPETKKVFEYLGCHWHGHPRSECFNPTTNSHGGFSLGDARVRTEHRLNLLRNHRDVSEVMVIYSCHWTRFLKENPDIKQQLEIAMGPREPLNLRSVFRGGIVGCFCAHFDSKKIAKASEEAFGRPPPDQGRGKFLDVVSFYPSLLTSSTVGFFEKEVDRIKLPYGPSTSVLTHELCMLTCPPSDWSKLVGAASVRILPPRHCRFPILRLDIMRNKQNTQMAPLCRSCAETASFLDGADCPHDNPEERSLEASFTLLELAYAIDVQGYQLLEVYQIHYYKDHTCEFLEKFLEGCAFLKVVSEGFPEDVTTEEQKETFVQNLSREMGFKIEVEDIMASPALRTGGKMTMNAAIGKLGQKIIRDSKHYVQDYQELANLRMDQTHIIKGYSVVSDKTVKITTQTEKAVAKPFRGGNLLVSAQCTAAARRELIKFLTMLEEEHGYVVCYSDTDSFLIAPLHPDCRPIEELVRVGSRLGSLKVEHSDIEAYTGLLKKAYVFSKKRDVPPNRPQEDLLVEQDPQPTQPSCHILAKAEQSFYPPPEADDPSHDTTIKFKGISNLANTLKANDACGIIQDELLDVLAQNPKPRYLIDQPRLLLNQQGKIGIWESPADNSFKRLAMNNSDRYFDMKNCVVTRDLEEDVEDNDDEESQQEERIMLSLTGMKIEGTKTKKKRKIELGPFVLTQPFGYVATEADQTSIVGRVLAQWRQSVSI